MDLTHHAATLAGAARTTRVLLTVVLVSLVTAGHVGGRPAAAQVPQPVDPEAVAAFVDAAVDEHMAEHDIPGATFVMVADGQIALARGYGHTDLDRTVPVDPASTRFDIGSVSKLVTATAVMQQVEQGRINLDADVDDYLRAFEVPDTFVEPVTTAHLLTHTGGFAERFFVGMVASGPGEAQPLAESLARDLPPRVRPPGVAHQYNNQGMALAGHLVENSSGQPFESYVTEHILQPLGMVHTTYGTTPHVVTDDAVPHSALAGPSAPVDPWYVNLLPAGGLWTTGEDIAAFMLAHLSGGEHEGARILDADTVEQMHATQFRPHPDVAGLGYGFFEHGPAGRRGLQHGGGWIGTGAHLYLLPDAGVGFFVVFNHDVGAALAGALVHDVVDRFLPIPPQAVVAPPAELIDASAFAGQYRWNRQDRSTFMRLVSTLFLGHLEVRADGEGSVTTTMPLLPDARWSQSAPGVFVEDGGAKTLVFETDGGQVTELHVMGAQLFSMERLAWYETTAFILGLLLAFVAILLVAAVGWPAGALRRRRRRRRGVPTVDATSAVRWTRRASGLASGLLVAFLVGFVAHFAADWAGMLQVSAALRSLLVVPLVAAALTLTLAFLVVWLWRTGEGSRAGRLYHTGIALTLLAFLPFLYHLRLLGFHY